jgi:hypothetical protein
VRVDECVMAERAMWEVYKLQTWYRMASLGGWPEGEEEATHDSITDCHMFAKMHFEPSRDLPFLPACAMDISALFASILDAPRH